MIVKNYFTLSLNIEYSHDSYRVSLIVWSGITKALPEEPRPIKPKIR